MARRRVAQGEISDGRPACQANGRSLLAADPALDEQTRVVVLAAYDGAVHAVGKARARLERTNRAR
jgi:hypothetical protein